MSLSGQPLSTSYYCRVKPQPAGKRGDHCHIIYRRHSFRRFFENIWRRRNYSRPQAGHLSASPRLFLFSVVCALVSREDIAAPSSPLGNKHACATTPSPETANIHIRGQTGTMLPARVVRENRVANLHRRLKMYDSRQKCTDRSCTNVKCTDCSRTNVNTSRFLHFPHEL